MIRMARFAMIGVAISALVMPTKAFGQFFDHRVHDVIVSDSQIYHVLVDSIVNHPPFTNRTPPRVRLKIKDILKGSPPDRQMVAVWQPHQLRLLCEVGEESTMARWGRRPNPPPPSGAWIVSGEWFRGELTVTGATPDSGDAAMIVKKGLDDYTASVERDRAEREAEDKFYSSYIRNALPALDLDSVLARSCAVVSGTVVDIWVGIRGTTVRLDSLTWLTGPETIPKIMDLESSSPVGTQMNFAPVCSWKELSASRAGTVKGLLKRGSRIIAFKFTKNLPVRFRHIALHDILRRPACLCSLSC